MAGLGISDRPIMNGEGFYLTLSPGDQRTLFPVSCIYSFLPSPCPSDGPVFINYISTHPFFIQVKAQKHPGKVYSKISEIPIVEIPRGWKLHRERTWLVRSRIGTRVAAIPPVRFWWFQRRILRLPEQNCQTVEKLAGEFLHILIFIRCPHGVRICHLTQNFVHMGSSLIARDHTLVFRLLNGGNLFVRVSGGLLLACDSGNLQCCG